MAITNLRGTTWYFNSTISVSEFYYDINFVSNNRDFTSISRWESSRGSTVENYLGYNDEYAYITGTWQNQSYRTITIKGGIDEQNPSLINWITSNATYQGCAGQWKFKPRIDTDFSQRQSWHINFYTPPFTYDIWRGLATNNSLIFGYNYMEYEDLDRNYSKVYIEPNWEDDEYRTITISGGADIANLDLLSFLQNNTIAEEKSILAFAKVNNSWKEGNMLIKANNTWRELQSALIKQNNTWTEI